MFFYQSVLERRTGCFSTIWLAATKGRKLQKREYLKVNVPQTCNDVMEYVLARVPPPRPGLPRPRFSLYLSSQLLNGTVVVYHRQCTMLLEEIQGVVERFHTKAKTLKIDMEEHGRHGVNVPDALSLLEESEWAQDPFFGEMHPVPISPSTLMQVMRGASPERPLLASPRTLPPQDDITAARESITLVEREPITLAFPQFEEAELAEVIFEETGMIDLLLEQPDEFPGWETEREAGPDQDRGISLPASPVELQPTTLLSEDPLVQPREESGLPTEMPAAPSDERTPLLPSSPGHGEERAVGGESERQRESLTLADISPPPGRPSRKRRMVIDQETQISQDAVREQMDDPLTETNKATVDPPAHKRRVSPVDLLGRPCTTLHPDLLLLWQQAAAIRPLSSAAPQVGERGRDSDSGEKEGEPEGEEEELPSTEVPRELSASGLFADVSAPSLLSEGSVGLSREISPVDPPEIKESVSRLKGIPEECEGPLESEAQYLPAEDLFAGLAVSGAEREEEEGEAMLFHSRLPPMADRRTVADSFWILLVNVSTRRLCVQQDEPYGDISITPGPNYQEETVM